MMTEVSDLYPPRWKVTQFPDEVALRLLTAAAGAPLERLAIHHWSGDTSNLEALCRGEGLPNLRWLAFEGCRLGAALGQLLDGPLAKQLRHLALDHCALDDDTIRHLARHPGLRESRLETLSLRGNPITDGGAAVLGRSPVLGGLETLDLRGHSFGQQGVMALRTSARLEGVRLRY